MSRTLVDLVSTHPIAMSPITPLGLSGTHMSDDTRQDTQKYFLPWQASSSAYVIYDVRWVQNVTRSRSNKQRSLEYEVQQSTGPPALSPLITSVLKASRVDFSSRLAPRSM